MCVRVCGRCTVMVNFVNFFSITKKCWKCKSCQERRTRNKNAAQCEKFPLFVSQLTNMLCSTLLRSRIRSLCALALFYYCVLSMHQFVNWFMSIIKATHFLGTSRDCIKWLTSHSCGFSFCLLFLFCFVLFSNFILKYLF